jgi:hypothetical protein|tara:strand:+ start:410 stop:781 length:372 start_codon:yes stop_codon:yes gene_type:complete
MGKFEKLQKGDLPSVRGLIKCHACKWWQAYVSQIVKGREYKYETKGIQAMRRVSKCTNCGKRNQFRMTARWHGHPGRKKCVKFVRSDDDFPRDLLVTAAQLKNIHKENYLGGPRNNFKLGSDI